MFLFDEFLLPTCTLGFEAPNFAFSGEGTSRRTMGSLPEPAIGRLHCPERRPSPVEGGC